MSRHSRKPHLSEEPGAKIALDAVGLCAPLRMRMRLGEGSGCPLMFELLEAACAVYNDMGTFSDAGIDNSYLEDLNNTYNCIYSACGVKPDIIRFPGGSINDYNRLIYNQLIAEVTRRGFVYYDWNVSGQDASNSATWTSIYRNILNGIDSNETQRAIILLHDGKGRETTVTTVEDIIIALIDKGYTFEALDNTVRPINFSYTE